MRVTFTLKREVPQLLSSFCSLLTGCAVLGLTASQIGFATPQQPPVPSRDIAGSPGRTASVSATGSPIEIDGNLNESSWTNAPLIGDLVQRIPNTGAEPSERTEVKLLHDSNFLYVGVVCYDSEPSRVLATQLSRDANLASDDRITIVIDTYSDQNNGFYFSTNPEGALVDGLIFANGQTNTDWDSIWIVRTRRTRESWTAEFAIPFKSLSFPAGVSTWGFNISRVIQRKLEEDRWTGAARNIQLIYQVSEAGQATDLENITQGIGMDIRPFIAGRVLRYGANGETAFLGKPGLDMFYNVTPNLKLTVTANTDFGDTEVDARQINLGRFSLLFPEKRTFFLENTGIFNFGGNGPAPPPGVPATGADIFPFFSRQIGLVNLGSGTEEVPIDYGVKLTGKIGRTDLGLLNVRTRAIGSISAKEFLVARVRQNFWSQSYLGAILTAGNPSADRSSITAGADLRLATSRLLGTARNLLINAYALKSMNEGNSDRDVSWGFSAEFPNDRYQGQFILREIQNNFRPAVGFVQRRNVRMMRLGASFNPRPKDFLNIQQLFHDFYFTRFTRLDNGLVESWYFYATVIDWHFNTGDSMHSLMDVDHSYERLFSNFEISPGVVLPPGEYEFTRFRSSFVSSAQRRVSGNVSYAFGNYWSGTAQQMTAGAAYRVAPNFQASVSANQTFARLPQGNFTARIFSANLNYSFSPFLTFSNLLQYDNASHNLGWQSRARWTLKPGNDLFFIFGQGWIQDDAGGYHFKAQDTKIVTKLQYTFRF